METELEELLQNSLSIWFSKSTEPFEVKLYADENAAKYFKRRPLSTQIVECLNSDGTMEFSIKITHEMEILPIVKYWIPHLHIIEPQWIQDIIDDDLKEYLNDISNREHLE